MAVTTPDIATRITFTLPSVGSVSVYDIDGQFERELVETTNFGTTVPTTNQIGGRTYIPADFDNDVEFTLETDWDPDTVATGLRQSSAGAFTMTFSMGTTTTVYSGNAWIRSWNPSFELNGLLTGTLVLRVNGVLAVTVN